MKSKQLFIIALLLLTTLACRKQNARYEKDLSNQNWSIWLDKEAGWQHDSLFLPPVNIKELKIHEPTCGWKTLYEKHNIETHIPATVEQFYWGTFPSQKDSILDLGWTKTPAKLKEDYTGVSWFYTETEVPASLKNKRIVLHFESCRQRAEVLVNDKLAGYDCIGNTPFDVDITGAVIIGQKNNIAVRITDPGGQYDWMDFMPYIWGRYEIPASHAFGGITGKVKLVATDETYIDDIWIKNKPTIRDIDAVFSMASNGKRSVPVPGTIVYTISDYKTPDHILFRKKIKINSSETTEKITLAEVKFWSPEMPELYLLRANWDGEDGSTDFKEQRFGFRWLDVRDVNGDKQLFLNDKRIFLLTAISWSYWPQNGIFPTPELAKKQITVAKQLGLNMLNFHRAIGATILLDLADEMGLMLYEEPGGYIAPEKNAGKFAHQFNVEKINRMIRRDRSHPSLVIYSMKNEACCSAGDNDKKNIAGFHQLDETRIITFSSQYYPPDFLNGKAPKTPHDAKLYMLPYNHELLYQGWWDEHHAAGPGCYIDTMHYENPSAYNLFTAHKSEIIYYGEEGAIGTVSRIQLINDEVKKRNYPGFDGKYYQDIYNAYNQFIIGNHWEKYYRDVDAITVSMGNVAYYYQGRMIENCRINNITDGYAINGWESTLNDNLSGIVDMHRNPKGNIELISRYSKPLYIAVKPRHKVLESGDSTVIDFFIVNQSGISGDYILKIKIKDAQFVEEKEYPVKVEGGNTYGQLLVRDYHYHTQTLADSRYITVAADLVKDRQVVAKGDDNLYAVSLFFNNSDEYSVSDKSGELQKYFISKNIKYNIFNFSGKPRSKILVTGKGEVSVTDALVEWIKSGNKLIIIDGADRWADALAKKGLVQYQGRQTLRNIWWGGNFFNRQHAFFDGLPVNQALNWEYQVMVRYNTPQKEAGNDRYGLKLKSDEIICAAVNMEDPLITTAVGIVNIGQGKVIFSALPVLPYLNSHEKAAVTARKLLLNYIK